MKTRYKEVEFRYLKGAPRQVITALNRSMGQYKRNYQKIKVGITGRYPQSRFEEHLKLFNWDRMVVLYETGSMKFANTLEQWLTENHWNNLKNKKVGGGSELCQGGKCFLYVLLKTRII